MKQGPFLFITTREHFLGKNVPGALDPPSVDAKHLSSACAVLIDTSLDGNARQAVVDRCALREIPVFDWPFTHNAEPDIDVHLETLNRFLAEQNGWPRLKPSPDTVDRIQLQTLIDIITTANSHLEPQEVMRTVMSHIHQLIPCEAWSVLILDNSQSETLSFAAAYPREEPLVNLKVPFGQGVAGWVAKNRRPLLVRDVREDSRFLDEIDKNTNFKTRSILCAPLISRGRTLGVIEMLNSTSRQGFSEPDLELVQILVNPAAVAIENAFLFQKAQLLTTQDDLTKLHNSRHLNQVLEKEISRSRRSGKPVSLIFLDLDGFKAINDNYGHLQGSQSLVIIGRIIKDSARETDVVGRYGGDEFMLILPETDTLGAVHVAERIRNRIESYHLHELQMTASIGIATYPDHGHAREDLIRKADLAMYGVKERGKNGILVADKP